MTTMAEPEDWVIRERQKVHEELAANDPEHDQSSCYCCCENCNGADDV